VRVEHQQGAYDVRCEWGRHGVELLARECAVVVIVDVLSFCTSVDVAVGRGARVLPQRWHNPYAAREAATPGALMFEATSGGAKAAAGDADVMVHGADLAQSLLREGLLDELEIHLIPVILGDGRRLFGAERTELELSRVLDAPGVTHLRYRVVSSAAVG